MKPSTFLSLYEKLEHLVQRLPAPLQQPILREITPIKTLFLLQRAPRLVLLGTLAMATGGEIARLAELIAIELPGEAQLEMARLSGNRALQKQIAQVVIKSVTAICAAIGTQPIPLADFPILTSLQATMVAGIMHISGREWSPKLAAEFIAALGAN